MAQRYLALDWDQNQLHIVAATVGGGSVKYSRALLLEDMGTPSRAKAEELGRLLRDRLKEYNIAPAPVLGCVGRDKLILKEIRFPSVPAHEEAGIVRFQVVKELTEAAEEVVIDYTTLPSEKADGERHAQVFVAKRELVEAWQQICQAAGLKLAGLTPRALSMSACLRSLIGTSVLVPPPEPANAPVALITVGEKWAEFAILNGTTILQARTLALGPGLAGEIRRNIAVYGAQQSRDPVKAVYLALSGEQAALREKLVQSLDVPVHPFDPFAGAEGKELPSSGRGTFIGAAGMLRLAARSSKLPVNFAEIKQVSAPKDPNQRMHLLTAVLVLVLVGAGVVLGKTSLDKKKKALAGLTEELQDLEKKTTDAKTDRVRMQALFDWEQVCWPDDLYEMTRALPQASKTYRVTKVEGNPERLATSGPVTTPGQKQAALPPVKELNSKPAARLTVEMKASESKLLNELSDLLKKAGKDADGRSYYLPESHESRAGTYKKDIKIRKRPPEDFKEKAN